MTAKATRGGQIGNKNAEKPRLWSDALRKYAVQNPETVARAVAAMWEKAAAGDVQAAKEIVDRLEGKPIQGVEQKTEIVATMTHHVAPELSKEEWLKAFKP